MVAQIPTEEEVLGYFDRLSNWGRWGKNDQRGTLNFLSSEKTRQAAMLVQDGEVVSCARTITFQYEADIPRPPLHYMLESGEGWASGEKLSARPSQGAMDFIGMVFHGWAITHVDALSHFFWEGKMYNGQPAHLVSTGLGATAESIELAATGDRYPRRPGRRSARSRDRLGRARRWGDAGRYTGRRRAVRFHDRGGRRSAGADWPAPAPCARGPRST